MEAAAQKTKALMSQIEKYDDKLGEDKEVLNENKNLIK